MEPWDSLNHVRVAQGHISPIVDRRILSTSNGIPVKDSRCLFSNTRAVLKLVSKLNMAHLIFQQLIDCKRNAAKELPERVFKDNTAYSVKCKYSSAGLLSRKSQTRVEYCVNRNGVDFRNYLKVDIPASDPELTFKRNTQSHFVKQG